MAQRPTARGLFLCDQVVVEEGTRNWTLVNCFRRKGVRRDPPDPFSFTVVAFLNGGRGDIKLEVVINRLDTGAELLRWEDRGRFPDPLREFYLRLRVSGFAFPAPGAYEIVLLADGEPIAQSRLTVFQQRRAT